jgi:hypothetical protein
LEYWELRPFALNEAVLEIVTRSKKEIQIKIGEGYCRLFRSRDGELRDLEEIKFTPIQLLQVRKVISLTTSFNGDFRNWLLVESTSFLMNSVESISTK